MIASHDLVLVLLLLALMVDITLFFTQRLAGPAAILFGMVIVAIFFVVVGGH